MGTGRVVPPHGIPGKIQSNRPSVLSPARGNGVVRAMATEPSKAKPAPPPPYRPQQGPAVMQAKFSHANLRFNSPKHTPIAPPVFRPQAGSKVMQPKMAGVANLRPAPATPPHGLVHTRMPELASSSGRRHGVIQRQISLNGTPQTTVAPITAHLNMYAPTNTVTTHASYAQIVTGMLVGGAPAVLTVGTSLVTPFWRGA
jgi:hypothetical protein